MKKANAVALALAAFLMSGSARAEAVCDIPCIAMVIVTLPFYCAYDNVTKLVDDKHNLARACAFGKSRKVEARAPTPEVDPRSAEDSPSAQEQSEEMAPCRTKNAPWVDRSE